MSRSPALRAEVSASLMVREQAGEQKGQGLALLGRERFQAPHRTSGLRLVGTAVRTPAGWRLRESRTVLAWMRER
ncbi:hypothetical protein [Streptomyces sp. NPDC088755]|uniref:hypothetical protein n=1 Tax=Streptomyces sp. NPDC088755 TaxID=3365888 RepID=UPI00380EC7A9